MSKDTLNVINKIISKIEIYRKEAGDGYGKNDEHQEFHFAQYCAYDDLIKNVKYEYGI